MKIQQIIKIQIIIKKMARPKISAETFRSLLILYNKLPYIAIENKKKHYLIPHRPSKPKTINFSIATQKIKQHSQKYNQYFSSQKLWQKVSQKVSQKFKPSIKDIQNTQNNAIQSSQLLQLQQRHNEFLRAKNQYNYKYKQPLVLINLNSWALFTKQEYRKIKQQEEKSKQKSQQKSTDKNGNLKYSKTSNKNQSTPQMKRIKYAIKLSNLQKMNRLKLSQKWENMTLQQKQVYKDMQQKIKQQNAQRIRQFIQNHQIPVPKRYPVISRFITRYAAQYQLSVKDKRLYQKYHQLPKQQKQQLSIQAKQLNYQSQLKYNNFLKKWKLSKEQLNYIIQISDKYHKGRKNRQSKKLKKKQEQNQEFIDEDDDNQLDFQNQQFNNQKNK